MRISGRGMRRRGRNSHGTSIEVLEPRALCAGASDTLVQLPLGYNAALSAAATQGDGKIVVCGYTKEPQPAPGAVSSRDFLVARLNPDLTLDTTFGPAHTGVVLTDVLNAGPPGKPGASDEANDVLVQADGKIVVVGMSSFLAVAVRYNADGTLDSSFGNNGDTDPDVPRFGLGPISAPPGVCVIHWRPADSYAMVRQDAARAVAAAPDGSGAFYVSGAATESSSGWYTVAKLTPDGKLDASFGTREYPPTYTGDRSTEPQGFLAVPSGPGRADATALSVLPDGRVVLAGHAFASRARPRPGAPAALSGVGLARATADGKIDASFGGAGDGRAFTPGLPWGGAAVDMAVQPDGKIVTAGYKVVSVVIFLDPAGLAAPEARPSNISWWVNRYNADGTPDPTFGRHGTTLIRAAKLGLATNVTLAADGKILVGGLTAHTKAEIDLNQFGYAAARLLPNGKLDKTFGALPRGTPGPRPARRLPGVINLPVAPPADGRPDGGPVHPIGPTTSPERAPIVPDPGAAAGPEAGNAMLALSAANSVLSIVRLSDALGPPTPPPPPVPGAVAPDLQVQAVSNLTAQPPSYMNPEFVEVTVPNGTAERSGRVTLRNAGTATAAGTVSVRLLASSDKTVDGADAVLAETTVTLRLARGRSRTVLLPRFTYAGQFPDGVAYLLVQVDGGGAVAEADETNNVRLVAQIHKFPAILPPS